MVPDLVEAVFRHHRALFVEPLAAPVFFVPGAGEIEFAAGGFQHPDGLGHHFGADTVAGNDGDLIAVFGHGVSLEMTKAAVTALIASAGSFVKMNVDAAVVAALVFDLADAQASDLARAPDMGAAAGL